MGRRIMDRVLGFMGFDDEPGDEEEKQQPRETRRHQNEDEHGPAQIKKKGGQVVNLHTQSQVRVIVCEPRVYEDAQAIADHLKNRRPVIVNLEQTDPNLSKQVIDFVCGTTYALDGRMQKVGNGIFLFVPSNMNIDGKVSESLDEKTMFAFIK